MMYDILEAVWEGAVRVPGKVLFLIGSWQFRRTAVNPWWWP